MTSLKACRIGANDYITKPFRFAELRARARTQLMIKRLQDERKHTIDELRTAHEMKDRFLRIASHDMKGRSATCIWCII